MATHIGNSGSLRGCNQRSNDTAEHDYYATDPIAVEKLLEVETFDKYIWEPACGEGHISKVLEVHGYHVESSDLIYRGFGDKEPCDFLADDYAFDGDIITNPPYKYAQEFVEKALDSIDDGHKVAMFLKLTFVSSSGRIELFKNRPPQTIYVFSKRVECGKNGIFLGKKVLITHGSFGKKDI